MTNELIFLDTNVLMELLFRRPQHDLVLASVMALPEQAIVCTSVLSAAILLYFVETEKLDKTVAYGFVKGYKILNMTHADYLWAEENDQGDFEDALQVGCAKRHGCSSLLTLDKKFDRMYGKYLSILALNKGSS